MAISKSGPLGPFSGKLGPLNGYILRGKGVIRAFPRVVRPRTVKQLAVLQRMSAISPFFNLIAPYLSVGFQLSGIKNENSANNSAKSYNLRNAVKGEYPDQEIDYSAVRLTEGDLAVALNPLVTAAETGFKFTWEYDAYDATGNRNDKTMLMAFFPGKKIPFYMISGVKREKCEETLLVYPDLKGQEAETYLSFITDERKAISNSIYTGKIMF